ncbi:hypothetical protein N2152v2_000123 [Parachlorella kessleri]
MEAAILKKPWLKARERAQVEIFQDSEDISTVVAKEIAGLIRDRATKGQGCVLGLATGSTPRHVYRELVRMHCEEGLSFAGVTTFNLDEYWPIQPASLQSYHRFMHEHLFDHIDIPPGNIHIPSGTVPLWEIPRFCEEYEAAIEAAGGIDVQLLGLGRTGHIGFNEKGSSRASLTRLITLDKQVTEVTRVDAASDFFGEKNVPRQAITMGVATILKARRIILMAFGENKAAMVREAVEGPVSARVAASYLQQHPGALMLLDYAAAAGLTRVRCPWLVGPIRWDPVAVRKAVVWLSQEVKAPILKLTDEHYNENSLQDLLAQHGPAYTLNLRVFYGLQRTITGWPGGKPPGVWPGESMADLRSRLAKEGTDIKKAPSGENGAARGSGSAGAAATAGEGGIECGSIKAVGFPGAEQGAFPKRVLVMSPHPDDDVISMGGTLIRLVEQGHEVHCGYQTSGNIAVWDEDALRFADFTVQFGAAMGLDTSRSSEIARKIEGFLHAKAPGEVDSQEVQRIKTLIRYCEARSAGRTCGLDPAHLHFLDMPFYQTGKVIKAPLSDQDIQLVVDLLERIRPHQIYAAGDLSDPHGTHRVCLQAIFRALDMVRHRDWYSECGTEVLLYRGAWQRAAVLPLFALIRVHSRTSSAQALVRSAGARLGGAWEPWEADMVVPLSPGELARKIDAIYKHQSQKDRALFPGADPREFWERAQDRNRHTAQVYDRLGMPEYEAMEAFVHYDPDNPSTCTRPPARTMGTRLTWH